MGRHALSAAADSQHAEALPAPARPAPDAAVRRPRGRRSALGPAAARATLVEPTRQRRVVAMRPVPVPVVAAGSAVLTRTASLRAERALDPRHVRRAVNAKRAAVLLAPALALTSSLTLAVPANAATPSTAAHTGTTTSQPALAGVAADELQTYTVAHDVEVPVTAMDGVTTTTTVVSYPTVVTRFGVTTEQAESAISAALSAGGDRATILATALQYMGDPYVEGGASHSGIDCSGLTMVAYAAVGIPLVHYVPTQDAAAQTIPESEAKPGDLVVYDNEDHVGIFLGDGLVLQAPHPGEVVDIVPMYAAAHHFARLLPAGS
ncbi:MAG: C40 family peptidase [Curtobacterium sp.]